MLPKLLYEALPYLYIGSGCGCLLISDSPVLWISGLLFYAAGAIAWVTRANHRRHFNRNHPSFAYRDSERHTGEPLYHYKNHQPLPDIIYEYLPFAYILAGYACYQYYLLISASYTALVAIVLFTTAGGCTWLLRGYYRGYHRAPIPADYED